MSRDTEFQGILSSGHHDNSPIVKRMLHVYFLKLLHKCPLPSPTGRNLRAAADPGLQRRRDRVPAVPAVGQMWRSQWQHRERYTPYPPCLTGHVTSKSADADTVTSNQSVFLSLSIRSACFDSLLPSPVEEVYVQQLITRCKAWCASAVELISNLTLCADSWHCDFLSVVMSNCLCVQFAVWFAVETKPERLHWDLDHSWDPVCVGCPKYSQYPFKCSGKGELLLRCL